MFFPRALTGLLRAAAKNGRPSLKSVSELDPGLLAKARRLALGVGTAAGAFGSLVGVGGGVLIGPVILDACPSIPQRVISGTSLAAVATTGATAGAIYWHNRCVEERSAVLLATAAVLTAPLGARLTHKVDCQMLRQMLGYWLYFVAPLVPLKAVLFSKQQPPDNSAQQSHPPATQQQQPAASPVSVTTTAAPDNSSMFSSIYTRFKQELQQPVTQRDVALVATGSLAGLASGLLGIGGGTVVTPMLALATGAPQQVVLGTSLVAMVVPSLVGLAQHQKLGNVDWRMAAALAVGTSAGSYVGSKFAIQAPDGLLECLFAAGMLLLGRRTLVAASKGVPKAAQ